MNTAHQRLKKQVERQAKRMRNAEQQQSTLVGQAVYLGMLGLLFVLPVIGGVYLGYWLDSRAVGYSVVWTVLMLLLGVLVGAINVYLFIVKRE